MLATVSSALYALDTCNEGEGEVLENLLHVSFSPLAASRSVCRRPRPAAVQLSYPLFELDTFHELASLSCSHAWVYCYCCSQVPGSKTINQFWPDTCSHDLLVESLHEDLNYQNTACCWRAMAAAIQ